MILINVDFNNQTKDGCVSLETRGARWSLDGSSIYPGDQVVLIDDGIQTEAVVEKQDGHLVARPIKEIGQ